MKLVTGFLCACIHVYLSTGAIVNKRYLADHQTRAAVPRVGQYRGTWTLLCNGSPSNPDSHAWGACNNACFSTRCIEADSGRMTLGADDPTDTLKHQDRNRINSGCSLNNAGNINITVANYSPFSQLFVDLDQIQSPTCYEWPMADIQQLPITDTKRVPNSLRIIPASENSSAVGQYNVFKQNPGDGLGPLEAGDYWDFAWSDAGMSDDDKSHIPYCYATLGTDSCMNDGKQFYASYIGGDAQGKLSEPYDYLGDDNIYKLSPNPNKVFEKGNIRQCSLGIVRYFGTVNWDVDWYWLPQAIRGYTLPDVSLRNQKMDLNEQIVLEGPPQWLTITNIDNAPPMVGITAVKLNIDIDAHIGLSWTTPTWCSPQSVVISGGREAWSCDVPCFDGELTRGNSNTGINLEISEYWANLVVEVL